ncbi:hypothetical protein OSTOST_06303, partial [Ostertagia ostertagi]
MDVPILTPGVKESVVLQDDRRAKSLAYHISTPNITRSFVEAPHCAVTAGQYKGMRCRTGESSPSPKPMLRDGGHPTRAGGTILDASHHIDGEAHDTMYAEDLETLGVNEALGKTPLPESSLIAKANEEAPLKTAETSEQSFSELIFQDVLEDCSPSKVISDGLEGIGLEWPPMTIVNGCSSIIKTEDTFDMIAKEGTRTFIEAEAPPCDSISHDESTAVAGRDQANALRDASALEEALGHLSKSPITSCGDHFDMSSEKEEKKQGRAAKKSSSCSRKRTRESSKESQNLGGILRESNSNKNGTNHLKSLLKDGQQSTIFECSMLGCSSKLKWHPKVGRNRLVDHVRTHWNKEVKKCKLCDFTAKTARKIHHHHMHEHPNEAFMGAQSNETEEDLKELQRLYMQCFPGSDVHTVLPDHWHLH